MKKKTKIMLAIIALMLLVAFTCYLHWWVYAAEGVLAGLGFAVVGDKSEEEKDEKTD